MRTKDTSVWAVVLVGLAATRVCADGKVFRVYDRIPPDIPYQRAFVLFDEGSETLVVQSRYDVNTPSPAETLGWILPVPSVPELTSVNALMADLFFQRTSRLTGPRVHTISTSFYFIPVAVFLTGFVLLLRCLVQYPLIKRGKLPKATWDRRCSIGFAVTLVGFVLVTTFMPTLSRSASFSGVQVVKAEQVGIYDVKVIRGDSAEPVMEWLRENEFAFDETDRAAFADYVGRGWCFVTAKVRPGAETEESPIAVNGLPAPLVLTFDVNEPVYPLALTATAGTETEILIYTLSDAKLACKDRLELRCAREIDSRDVTDKLIIETEGDEWTPMEGLPDKRMMLCKFKGTMTAAQMREDLVFEAAPDNAPYRETKWVW